MTVSLDETRSVDLNVLTEWDARREGIAGPFFFMPDLEAGSTKSEDTAVSISTSRVAAYHSVSEFYIHPKEKYTYMETATMQPYFQPKRGVGE